MEGAPRIAQDLVILYNNYYASDTGENNQLYKKNRMSFSCESFISDLQSFLTKKPSYLGIGNHPLSQSYLGSRTERVKCLLPFSFALQMDDSVQ